MVSSIGFVLDELTMDAATYESCSFCDGRSDRTGNREVAAALRAYMTKNRIKTVIESGDVKLVERLPNQRMDTGNKCRPADVLRATVTAQMVNPKNELDSLSVDFDQALNMTFMTGEVPHKVTFKADVCVRLGAKIFGTCVRYGSKTCGTSSESKGVNTISVILSASEVQTFELQGQHYLEFILDVQVADKVKSETYAPMSVPYEKCDLRVLGIKVGSVHSQIQRGANNFLIQNNGKINELRGKRLIKKLEDVLKAKLRDTVRIPVSITGGTGRKLKTSDRSAKKCQRKKCPSGFLRIGNTQRCQKTFGFTKPNCSIYGSSATLTKKSVAGGRYTIYFCVVDMVEA